jgi:DNA replication protein DnaC
MIDRIADSLDLDPDYIKEPFVDYTDEELTEHELFMKYTPKLFPKKIANELISIYPTFQTSKTAALKKLVGNSLFLYGSPGTGKTYLACLFVLLSKKKTWLYLDLSTKFYRVSDLLDDFRKLVISRKEIDSKTGLPKYDSLIFELKKCKYLILDDLGAEKSTDFANDILDRIIDSRYSDNRITIVTTNFDIKTLVNDPGYSRIVSRLLDMVDGHPIHLTKVYRKLKIKPIEL